MRHDSWSNLGLGSKTHKTEQPTINHTNPVRKTLSWCDPCDIQIKWLHSHCCHSGTSHCSKLLHAVSICILQSCAAVRHVAAQTCKWDRMIWQMIVQSINTYRQYLILYTGAYIYIIYSKIIMLYIKQYNL